MRPELKGLLFVAVLVVLAGFAIAVIAMGRTPVGVAMLVLAIAPLPFAIRALKGGKTDDAR
ncbi:MAG: hypothetical protein ACRC1J_01305 [Sandaracinobacteroides sp.]